MSRFEESGVTVNLDGKPFFRFQDLACYRKISRKHVKEMNFCWLDGNRLILVELKSIGTQSDRREADQDIVKEIQTNICQKVQDSLLMLAACWLPTRWGNDLRNELDPQFHQVISSIEVVIVVDLHPRHRAQFGTLKDHLRDLLTGKLALFDIERLRICMPVDLPRTDYAAQLHPSTR